VSEKDFQIGPQFDQTDEFDLKDMANRRIEPENGYDFYAANGLRFDDKPQPNPTPSRQGTKPQDGQNNKKKVKRYKKGFIRTVNTLLSVVLAICLLATSACAALLYMDFSDSGSASADLDSIVKSESEDVAYFLVAGMDEGETLTDIMMVVCFDMKAGKANILQIPRDTFIGADVPTHKMNAVYGNAPREEGQTNINVMLRRINDYFGLPIDHYMTVSLSAFRDIVDAVGGVDVYIPDTIYGAFNEDRDRYTFQAGMNHLNGAQAEAFVRHRKSYAMGDLGRVKAQRNFYAAFIQKCLEMSYSQMTSVATSVYDDIATDMKLVDILAYAKAAQKLEKNSISFHSVPGQSGTYRVNGGQALSYYSVHKADYVELVNTNFMPYSAGVVAENLMLEELHTTYYESYIEDQSGLDGYLSAQTEEE
jgi:LCP family protein required for cell wall assembly